MAKRNHVWVVEQNLGDGHGWSPHLMYFHECDAEFLLPWLYMHHVAAKEVEPNGKARYPNLEFRVTKYESTRED